MRIHRLISIVVVLLILAAATMTLQRRLVGVETGTVSAQQTEPVQQDGYSSVAAAETSDKTDADLYLDADEVEKRAAEEQSSDRATDDALAARVPVSFKHVALPVKGGIDHAVAGVATRNSGQGVIRMRGIPPGSTLLSAILVWGEIAPNNLPYNIGFGADCTPLANVAGNSYGTTASPCWGGTQYVGYIANVTGQIVPGINGDYRVKGLRSSVTDNRCPWGDGACPPAAPGQFMSEGASLIVFYSNPCIPRAAQLYVNLGPRMFFGPHSVVHATPFPINPNLPNLKHSRIGADGQVGVTNCGLRSMPGITDERTWIENPITLGSIQIKGDGAGLNRDSDWNGYDGEPLNKLWDTHTDVFANSNFLAAGGGLSYRVRYLSQGDCIVWAVHILGVR
jgi:hypothetical protein